MTTDSLFDTDGSDMSTVYAVGSVDTVGTSATLPSPLPLPMSEHTPLSASSQEVAETVYPYTAGPYDQDAWSEPVRDQRVSPSAWTSSRFQLSRPDGSVTQFAAVPSLRYPNTKLVIWSLAPDVPYESRISAEQLGFRLAPFVRFPEAPLSECGADDEGADYKYSYPVMIVQAGNDNAIASAIRSDHKYRDCAVSGRRG